MWTLWLSLCSVLAGSAAPAPPPSSAVCGRDSCYTAHLGRRTFHQAWRECRRRGGNLASMRRPDEQRLLEELLRDWEAAAPLRLWLGLQRQPRRCAPHKPLRGFTWTTGHQDTQFTNWLSPEPPGPCPDTRCAAITLGAASADYKWLGGPCRLAVDGYLCRYTYRGMCSPIELGLDEPVSYAAPFGITSTTLRYAPFGSVATLPCPEPVSVLCALSEDGEGVDWSGRPPFCRRGCEGPSCGCPPGYKLVAGGRGCVDADECAASPCHHLCLNTASGIRCSCRVGYTLRRSGGSECVDVDECQFQGSCQQMCVNYPGHFECHCGEGYALEEDGSSCRPLGRVGAPFVGTEGLPLPAPGERWGEGREGREGLWRATRGGDTYPEPSTGTIVSGNILQFTGTPMRVEPLPDWSGTPLSGDSHPSPSGSPMGIEPLTDWSGTPVRRDHFPDPSIETPMRRDHIPDPSTESPVSIKPLPNWSGTLVGKGPLTDMSTVTPPSGALLPSPSGTPMGIEPLPDWSGTLMRGDHFPNPSTGTPVSVEPLSNWSGTPVGKGLLNDKFTQWEQTPSPVPTLSGTRMSNNALTDTSTMTPVRVEPYPNQSQIPVRGDPLPELSETPMKDPLPNTFTEAPEWVEPLPAPSETSVRGDVPAPSETPEWGHPPSTPSKTPVRGDPLPAPSSTPEGTDRPSPHHPSRPEGAPILPRGPGHPGEPREAGDTRWLLTALLVPVSVLGVVMLALAVACCVRGQSRNAADVYRWISHPSKAPDTGVHGTGCTPDTTETGSVITTWQTDVSRV